MAMAGWLRGGAVQPGEQYVLLVGDGAQLSLVLALSERLWSKGRSLVVSTLDEARAVAEQHLVVQVVVSEPIVGAPVIDRRGRVIPQTMAGDILNQVTGRIPLAMLDTTTLEAAVRRPRRGYDRTKRVVDIVVSLGALCVAAGPMIAFFLMMRLWRGEWSGLGSRTVVGRSGVPFALPYLTPGPVEGFDTRAARRMRFCLRATGLEFAPNLFMVLRGTMSLVGPRPVTPAGMTAGSRMSQTFALRCLVRPGLIGLPQVRSSYADVGRDARIALEYDLYYLAYRSPNLDARIVARGIVIMVVSWCRFVSGVLSSLVRKARATVLASGKRPNPARMAGVSLPVDDAGMPLAVEPCIVVGAGSGGRLLVQELKRDPEAGYWPVAFLDDAVDLVGTRIDDVPVVGNVESLLTVATREHVGAVVIAIPSADEPVIQRINRIARDARLRVMTMPSVGSVLRGEQATRLQPVQARDLLGRPVVATDGVRARQFLAGKRVLVTGAAGSIGSEVVRQALPGAPAVIIGLDNNESGLFDLQQELRVSHPGQEFVPVVASVVDEARITRLMERFRPDIIFHAAAYKHVPLMEDFPYEAIMTNIHGTSVMTRAARQFKVERFVMVSTDKAVRPTSVMGASKRIAELIVRDATADGVLSACAVRFGNVLGSRGSVIPLFEKQIEAGGPVTVTDARMTRYFMTIPEAAGLIIEAGAFGDRGVTYMLDMGEPVRIVDVAERLIRLHGKQPGRDIEIAFTGLRPGEKLFEELSLDFEAARLTAHPKIRILADAQSSARLPIAHLVDRLALAAAQGLAGDARSLVMQAVMDADGLTPSSDSGSVVAHAA